MLVNADICMLFLRKSHSTVQFSQRSRQTYLSTELFSLCLSVSVALIQTETTNNNANVLMWPIIFGSCLYGVEAVNLYIHKVGKWWTEKSRYESHVDRIFDWKWKWTEHIKYGNVKYYTLDKQRKMNNRVGITWCAKIDDNDKNRTDNREGKNNNKKNDTWRRWMRRKKKMKWERKKANQINCKETVLIVVVKSCVTLWMDQFWRLTTLFRQPQPVLASFACIY